MYQEFYRWHMVVFLVFLVFLSVGGVIFSTLIYSLIKLRKSKGEQTAHFHKHLAIEILWTMIPFLILVALAIPALIALQHDQDTSYKKSQRTHLEVPPIG